jgi:hypothetical protein
MPAGIPPIYTRYQLVYYGLQATYNTHRHKFIMIFLHLIYPYVHLHSYSESIALQTEIVCKQFVHLVSKNAEKQVISLCMSSTNDLVRQLAKVASCCSR